MKNISIVLPVHNEIDNLKKLILDWNYQLNEKKIDHEFVIVEDGSTDGTKNLISELETNFPIINLSQKEIRGYSRAVIDGIYASSKNW